MNHFIVVLDERRYLIVDLLRTARGTDGLTLEGSVVAASTSPVIARQIADNLEATDVR